MELVVFVFENLNTFQCVSVGYRMETVTKYQYFLDVPIFSALLLRPAAAKAIRGRAGGQGKRIFRIVRTGRACVPHTAS